MQDAIRGLYNLTTRSSAIGKSIPALTGLLVFFSTTVFGQVVLDDFSTDTVLHPNYEFVPVFGTPADGWAVTAGELRPSINSSGSATWLWKSGLVETLSQTGSSVSISLSLPAQANNPFPTSIGLFLTADTGLSGGFDISQTVENGRWSYTVGGSGTDDLDPPTGPVLLTVERTGQSGSDVEYTVSFSEGGLPSPLTQTITDSSASLMFGLFAYNTAGAGTPAALDNLTFTAVPEPSMYAAVFGFLALATAVIRTRTVRRV